MPHFCCLELIKTKEDHDLCNDDDFVALMNELGKYSTFVLTNIPEPIVPSQNKSSSGKFLQIYFKGHCI